MKWTQQIECPGGSNFEDDPVLLQENLPKKHGVIHKEQSKFVRLNRSRSLSLYRRPSRFKLRAIETVNQLNYAVFFFANLPLPGFFGTANISNARSSFISYTSSGTFIDRKFPSETT